MQNKGIIKLFAILFGLVSIYQLSFTFIANSAEDDAEAFAAQKISSEVKDYSALREIEETRYLDSIGNNDIIAGITYNTALVVAAMVPPFHLRFLLVYSLQIRNIENPCEPLDKMQMSVFF